MKLLKFADSEKSAEEKELEHVIRASKERADIVLKYDKVSHKYSEGRKGSFQGYGS